MEDTEELFLIISFEQILRKLSTKLISNQDIDEGITYALQILTEFIGADLGFIYLLDAHQKIYESSYKWISSSLNADISLKKQIKSSDDLKYLVNGGSFVNIPLSRENEIIGLLGFITYKYDLALTDRYLGLLKIAGNTIFVNAIDKKHSAELLIRQKEELSQFARTMAHDIRNYLTTIEGYAQIIKDVKTYDPNLLEKIINQVHQIEDLMIHSLNLAEAGLIVESFEDVNLNDVVYNVKESTIPLSSVLLECGHLPIVIGDHEKIIQIFKNLFENAILHGKPNNINIWFENGSLFIANDGKKISDAKRKTLFEVPTSFRRLKEGPGLGLKIVKKLVEAHGWQIMLTSDTKTTFQIQVKQFFYPEENPIN